MTKLAPTSPRGKRPTKPEANRATGWRSVEEDGVPAVGHFPVFVLRTGGVERAFIAHAVHRLTCGRSWACPLPGNRLFAAEVSGSDWWIPVERLRAMVRVVARGRARGLP